MMIDSVECYLVRLPFRKPQRMVDRLETALTTVVTRVTGDGLSGWSEVSPGNGPFLTGEWAGGVFCALERICLPMVKAKRSFTKPQELVDAMSAVRGNEYAKAAIEMAAWDLFARSKKEPLWKTLGGADRPIPLGLCFDRFEEPSDYYPELARFLADGYTRATIKLRPGWDIQAVSAARGELPFGVLLQVDVEGGLDFNKYTEIFYRLEDFFLTLLEQPVAATDQVTLAMMQNSLRTPICLDESLRTVLDAEIAADLQSAKFFCLKSDRSGGHAATLAMEKLANENRIGCYAGMELGSTLAWRHTLSVASLSGCTLPCDSYRFDEVFEEDLTVPVATERVPRGGLLPGKATTPDPVLVASLWHEPGIGCDVDEDQLARLAVEKITW